MTQNIHQTQSSSLLLTLKNQTLMTKLLMSSLIQMNGKHEFYKDLHFSYF